MFKSFWRFFAASASLMCIGLMSMLVDIEPGNSSTSQTTTASSLPGSTESALPRQVLAKHYRKGKMKEVAINRGLWERGEEDPSITGYASIPQINCRRCPLIGKIVVCQFWNPRKFDPKTRQRGAWGNEERLLIVDCSQCVDVRRHLAEGPGIEADYTTAERNGFAWDPRTNRGAGKTQARIIRWEDK